MTKAKYGSLLTLLILACTEENNRTGPEKIVRFEKINYYSFPQDGTSQAIKSRLTYYFENGKPYRWIELDASHKIMTDYIYEYDQNWIQVGAKYKEPRENLYATEKVRFTNDSTKVTEWIDSTGVVFYTMVDDLNEHGKTYRATFKGDKIQGYDSTSYTEQGYPERIFFTNTKGEMFHDRHFKYDSIDLNQEWIIRRKIMKDTITEIQIRQVLYDSSFVSEDNVFYPEVLSTAEFSENSINFTESNTMVFQTRTSGWENQSAFITSYENGLFTEPRPVKLLDSIYNGAISPDGNRIIFSVKENGSEIIKITSRTQEGWSEPINLTEKSSISGGYFYWYSEKEIYFYIPDNNGDIVKGRLENDTLKITDALDGLNTVHATEFSPYIDKNGRFILFTRYFEGDESQQGFFISYKMDNSIEENWSEPKKLNMLPYGWSGNVLRETNQFIYSNGDDIIAVPLGDLRLNTTTIVDYK